MKIAFFQHILQNDSKISTHRLFSYILLFLSSWDEPEGRWREELTFMVVSRKKHSWKIIMPRKMSFTCLFIQRRHNLYIDI